MSQNWLKLILQTGIVGPDLSPIKKFEFLCNVNLFLLIYKILLFENKIFSFEQ